MNQGLCSRAPSTRAGHIRGKFSLPSPTTLAPDLPRKNLFDIYPVAPPTTPPHPTRHWSSPGPQEHSESLKCSAAMQDEYNYSSRPHATPLTRQVRLGRSRRKGFDRQAAVWCFRAPRWNEPLSGSTSRTTAMTESGMRAIRPSISSSSQAHMGMYLISCSIDGNTDG